MSHNIGIVGVGTIAEAIVEGFIFRRKDGLSISLSPRGARVAARLEARYPRIVHAAKSNQEVLDRSQTVILAVPPPALREVLANLAFQDSHHVINVVAGFSRDDVLSLVAPCREVTQAIPLPAIARGNAPTVLLPPNESAATLFRRGGPVTEVTDERAYAALGTSTAIMASYFALAKTVARWLANQGVPEIDSRNYVAHLLQGLAETTQFNLDKGYHALEEIHATPGSFNDALRSYLEEQGAFKSLEAGLDRLMKRMTGETP